MTGPSGGAHDETPAAVELRIGEAVERDGELVVPVEGELDMATAGALEARLREAEGLRLPVVVDALGLTFIDSTGIALLLASHERLRDAGGLRVRAGPGAVLRALELTGAADVLRVQAESSADD